MTSKEQLLSRPYAVYESVGVSSLIAVGAVSLAAILIWLVTLRYSYKIDRQTNVFFYFFCLLLANTFQSVGGLMNARWVQENAISAGKFCTAQAVMKQVGNVGSAVWSLVMAVHIFNFLFRRAPSTRLGLALTLSFGWSFIAFIVAIGPLAIQKPDKGKYFGISGYWCWITDEYPKEQEFLEYFFEFLSATFGFFLYTAILLCVRGNIIQANGRWRFRFVPFGASWQLAIHRDAIDSSLMRLAAHMVWFPVAYSILLLPMSFVRLSEIAGKEASFWAVMLCDAIFNSQGLVNIILVMVSFHMIPDTGTLPEFTTPRKSFDPASLEAVGITPFELTEASAGAEKHAQSQQPQQHHQDRPSRDGGSRSDMHSSSNNWAATLRGTKNGWLPLP